MRMVYIIDRDGELDVYASLYDAQEASEIVGLPYQEQVVFEESGTDTGYGSTREWLETLRKEEGSNDCR